jgi:hypothetical protein
MPYGWTQPVPHIQPYHLRTATFSFLPESRASHSAGGGGPRGASAGCLMSAVRGGGGHDDEALLSFTLVGRRRISPSPIRPPARGGWPSLALLAWEQRWVRDERLRPPTTVTPVGSNSEFRRCACRWYFLF